MSYNYRSATGRADMPPRRVPRTGCAVMIVLLLVATLCGIAWLCLRDKTPPETETYKSVQRHDSLTYTHTHDGKDTIRVYVVTDPDTQVQYVVSDNGGICPRLDRYGVPMGTVTEDTTTYD